MSAQVSNIVFLILKEADFFIVLTYSFTAST